MKNKIAVLTVQKWGNSLAVRIPVVIARSLHFLPGTPVELILQDGNIIVKPTGKRKLTLDERLALFDPKIQEGEVMAAKLVGLEKL